MNRPLSAPETFIWAGGKISRNFAIVAHIKGHISENQLQKAWEKTLQEEKYISGRIILKKGIPWYKTEGVPQPSIRISTSDWKEEASVELIRVFPASVGPLLRFVLAQKGDYTDLIIICHHCIADGLSLIYLLRKLLTFMALPETQVNPTPLLPEFADLLPEIDYSPQDFPEMKTQPVINQKASMTESPPYILSWSMDENLLKNLASRCRRENTSIHAALCTAFFEAFVQTGFVNPSRVHRISTPISIRNRLKNPIGEKFGLFIHPGIKVGFDNFSFVGEFWDKARAIKEILNLQINCKEFFDLFYLGEYMLKNMPLQQAIQFNELPVDYDLSVSNLGRLTIPANYGPFRLEEIYGPLVNGMQSESVVGISTLSDRMTFTFVTRHCLMELKMAEQIRDLVIQQIKDATQLFLPENWLKINK